MAFVRPIVYVYQEFTNVALSPGTPDLNCCIVGPAYNIQDYTTDKTDIVLADFIKSGETANAPCTSTGTSFGRPAPGTDFVTVTDSSRPEHIAGAVLDDDSVQIYFDDLYIEVAIGAAGAWVDEAGAGGGDGDYRIKQTGADFSGLDASGAAVNAAGVEKIAAGDRIILTKSPGGDGATTVVKAVAYVVSSEILALTSTKKATEDTGNTLIRWRVEHKLDDQLLDAAYYSISAGDLTITTGALGILMTYQALTWPVNYSKMYYGYRELRTDLDDVLVINSIDEVTASSGALIGPVDERNPLATGVKVALANTGNSVQVFGVATDDLTGHQSARDRMTSRDDVYAITPVTDALTGSTWVNVINMWKAHCVAFAAYDVAKFRVVLGSYDVLPTEKASAPASLVGHSMTSPAELTATGIGVFVDPASAANFLTAAVASTHLLDIAHVTTASLKTVDDEKHLFSVTGYAGAKTILGAMGSKRIRMTIADKFTAAVAADTVNYAVRAPILKSEGVASGSIYADTTGATWGNDGGGGGRITKTGAFANVIVGDIAHVSGDGVTAAHNDGFVITAVDVLTNYIDVEITEVTAGTVTVQVYRPVESTALGTLTAATRTVTGAGATDFANVAIGDLCVVLQSTASANIGMWVVQNLIDDQNIVIGDPNTDLVNELVGATNVVFFRTVASAADTAITVRSRLNRLRDDTASFTTTVEAAEDINIPYPADTDITKWDTPTTQWPIETVVNDNMLDAQLTTLEELAPKAFVIGYAGDMPYRVSIDLNRDSQVTELNTITTSLASSRCVMTWPNEVYVSGVENELTSTQSRQKGQYLSCAVGGMVCGLPSHQGFTYIGIGGIQQIFNSNFYFTEDQLTDLRDGGWYVFKQDSSSSLPYTIHEVTTDVSAYEFGEFMSVKNFDYVALYMKLVLEGFLGKYNITTETLEAIRASLDSAAAYLKLRIFPKIGVPLIDASITYLAQSATETDRVEVYMDVTLPSVLNKIGLHLVA